MRPKMTELIVKLNFYQHLSEVHNGKRKHGEALVEFANQISNSVAKYSLQTSVIHYVTNE